MWLNCGVNVCDGLGMCGLVIFLCGFGIVVVCVCIDFGVGWCGFGVFSDVVVVDLFVGGCDVVLFFECDGGGVVFVCGDWVVDFSLNEVCDDGN